LKKTALFLFLFFAYQSSVAQNFDIKLFNGNTKRTKERLQGNIKEYKRIKKENLDYIKERKKRYKAMKDSLNSFEANNSTLSKDSLKLLRKQQMKHFIYTDSLYSMEDIGSWDSLQTASKEKALNVTQEKLEGNEYYDRYKLLETQIGSYKKEIKTYRDSLKSIDGLDKDQRRLMINQKRQELSKKYETDMESVTKDIVNQKVPNLPGGFQNEKLDSFKEANEHLMNPPDKEKLLSKAQSTDYFKGKTEVLKAAMDEVSSLKEKYSKVIDSNDLSTAVKINSLEEKPMVERFIFGGTFQIHIDDNTSLDLNPEIGYRINKQFDIGLGGTYRLNVATEDFFNSIQEKQVIGYRGFVEHLLMKSFWFHGELEALKGTFQNNTEEFKEWNYSLLVGLERRFTLSGNVSGQVSILYNFMYANHPLYRSPWSFRFGFNVNGKK